eukprot:418186-Pleurochrysis_carterae.AAC.1
MMLRAAVICTVDATVSPFASPAARRVGVVCGTCKNHIPGLIISMHCRYYATAFATLLTGCSSPPKCAQVVIQRSWRVKPGGRERLNMHYFRPAIAPAVHGLDQSSPYKLLKIRIARHMCSAEIDG